MKISRAFIVPAFCLLFAVIAVPAAAQPANITGTPPLPDAALTYYYEGYDEPNNRHVYISTTGTYYYVDSNGVTFVGGASSGPIASPYRAVIADGGTTNFQFYNNNADNYTLTTITGTDGTLITATNFNVRSGTWFASDVTFNLTTSDASGLWIEGVSGTFSSTAAVVGNVVKYADGSARVIYDQPAVFSGTNINIIADTTNNSSRQAISIRNNAAVHLYGGTISKIATGSGDASETIYMVSNQEGNGTSTYFYGEDLTIISSGTALETFNMAAGNNVVELNRVTISSTLLNTAGAVSAISINNGTSELGGNHFSGTNVLINVTSSGSNRVLYLGATSGNTFTLVSSTIFANITGKAISSEIIFINDTSAAGTGNHFYGEDLLITNASGRIVTFGVNGANSFTLVSSTMINNGVGAAIAWHATTSSTGDRLASSVFLKDTTILTTASNAPVFQQIGNRAATTITSSTLITQGVGSNLMRLVAQNDNYDSTRNIVLITDSFLEAQNASVFDINIDAANTAAYGQAGGGGKNIGTKVEDSYEIIIRSSIVTGQVAALRVAAGGSGTSTYTNFTNVYVYDSTFAGRIEMHAGSISNFACGGNLVFTASNSTLSGGIFITGSTPFQRSNQATFYVYDSEWTGDIKLENRGNLVLEFHDTPIQGSLSASGSSNVQLRLDNSTITGSIATADTAIVTGEIVGKDAIESVNTSGGLIDLILEHAPTGSITAGGTGRIALRIGNDVAFEDGIEIVGNSTVAITLRDSTHLNSDLTILDRATFALATSRNTPVTLVGNVTLAGIWQIPSTTTTLNGGLTLTGSLGTISIIDTRPDILTLTQGLSGKGRLDIQSIDGVEYGAPEFRIIHDQTGAFAADALILSHPVDYGLAEYTLDNRPDGAYLVGGLGAAGTAVFNSQALAAEDWFASLAPVNNHLNDLRRINNMIFSGASSAATARGDTGAFWLQGHADTTRVTKGGALDFDSRTIGLTAGADARWDHDTSTITTGIFLDTARTDRNFVGTADGSTNAFGGGAYALYHHRKGFFLSAVGRLDTYQTTLNTNNPSNAMSAGYKSQVGGIALDIGWRFELANSGWWYEPAWQISFASIPGVAYRVIPSVKDNAISVSNGDARATQNVFRFSLGKDLSQKWSIRGYLAAANVNASGGAFIARGVDKDAIFMIDGDRIEAAIGVGRQIGRAGRLTLDAVYTDADKYQRPCSVFIGYNIGW